MTQATQRSINLNGGVLKYRYEEAESAIHVECGGCRYRLAVEGKNLDELAVRRHMRHAISEGLLSN